MIAVCVTFTIKTGAMDTFMASMEKQAADSVSSEPGCRRFDICADGDEPDTVFLYELYDSRDAFQEHLDSAHFKAFDRRVTDLVSRKDVRIFDTVLGG